MTYSINNEVIVKQYINCIVFVLTFPRKKNIFIDKCLSISVCFYIYLFNLYPINFHIKALIDLLFMSNKVTLKSYLKQDNVTPHTPTQHYLVLIRLQRKISFVTSFTFSK